MARQATFRIAELADLFRQMDMVSASVRKRAMDAAEALLADIQPLQNYPLDFIIYRITGYRSKKQGNSTTLVGEVLLVDLATLVQRLSRSLELSVDVDGRQALMMDDVAGRLNVSIKTVQRYRRLGLVCHHVTIDGLPRLVCFADALQRFKDNRRAPLKKASSFTRLGTEMQQRMIEQAKLLRVTEKLTLNETAARLAIEHDRAHETVRGLLRRHDRTAEQPIFTERGPLTDREHRLIFRAHQWGVRTADIVQRVGRSRKAIHRVILRQRGERLRGLPIEFVALPTFELDDAQQVLLSPAAVRTKLNQPVFSTDALLLIEQVRKWVKISQQQEHALLGAYNFLKCRAVKRIGMLDTNPAAAELDAAETDLRWGALVKRKLVLHGCAVALQRVEHNLHRPLPAAPRETIVSSLHLAVDVARRTIETVDPQKDHRVARVCGYAMERTLAAGGQGSIESRAAARHDPGSVLIDDPFQQVCDWQRAITAPLRWIAQLTEIDSDVAELLTLHFGWGTAPPMTCAVLALQRDTTVGAITRAIDKGLAQLRQQSLNSINE